jgi:hypothetical protein
MKNIAVGLLALAMLAAASWIVVWLLNSQYGQYIALGALVLALAWVLGYIIRRGG